jgi:ElaB/YqjD/DUF883 family membrane-anchored ribosome-binding protein
MDNSTTGFSDRGQALADKAADRAQAGIRGAQDKANDAAHSLSNRVESARGAVQSGWSAVSDKASQARDFASDAADTVVNYTRNNPVKALGIAAAAGALVYAIIRALTPSRD